MKKLLLLFLLLETTGFSQQIDSVIFTYYAGYRCTRTFDSLPFVGVCEAKEIVRYHRKKKGYQTNSFFTWNSFRAKSAVWDSDSLTPEKKNQLKVYLGPNLIKDSVKNPAASGGKKSRKKRSGSSYPGLVLFDQTPCFPIL